ncbi:MAG: peptide chain release factor N(5)-glutamine methyltransferase [Candidatus Methylomirabilis sp.]
MRGGKGSPSSLDYSAPLIFTGSGSVGYTYRQAVGRLKRAGLENALLDAACLLEAASHLPRWRFILEPERSLDGGSADLLESLLSRREAREPLAYILGLKEFWSLSLAVGPGVLIPRPETETLIEAVREKISSEFRVPSSELKKFQVGRSCCQPETRNPKPETANSKPETRNPKLRILDLGTGSGAIAFALAAEIPQGRIWAVDRSLDALRIARRNAEALGLAGRVHFLAGDLFEPLRAIHVGGGFDLIVSNPPYVPSGSLASLPPEVAAYEPHEALDGGPDGLHYHRRIIEAASGYLHEDGWLALEVGDGQAAEVARLIGRTGAFGPVEVEKDPAGRDRVVLAPRRTRAHG